MSNEQPADAAANTSEGTPASTAAPAAETTLLSGAADQQAKATGADAPPADGEKADSDDGEKPAGAPEKYEFKPQEGHSFDDSVIAAYSDVAKELNLSQDAAQKVLDKVAPVILARQLERNAEAVQGWKAASSADKEFGGEKLEANIAIAEKALNTFGSPELRSMLKETGLGNHPEIIRAFYKAGKAISEDAFVGSDTGARTPSGRDINATLYDKTNRKQ